MVLKKNKLKILSFKIFQIFDIQIIDFFRIGRGYNPSSPAENSLRNYGVFFYINSKTLSKAIPLEPFIRIIVSCKLMCLKSFEKESKVS